jgi:hypothetical protein
MTAAATHSKRERPGVVKATYATATPRRAIRMATAYRNGFWRLIGFSPRGATRGKYIIIFI